jgi:hypothetical protein
MAVEVIGWQWAFAFLALGPAAGITSIRRLVGHRRLRSAATTKKSGDPT